MSQNRTDKLGRIVGNLQSLEFALRAFLLATHNESPSIQYHLLQNGDEIEEDSFTNYDTLGDLVQKYNSQINKINTDLCISDEVIQLRDALAHGRIFTIHPEKPLRLLKFNKPQHGKVTVTHSEEMNQEWYRKNIELTLTELKKVVKGGQSINLKQFKDASFELS